MGAIQVGGRLVQGQDMCRSRKGLSQRHADNEGSQNLLPHGAPTLHLDKLPIFLHHDTVAISTVPLLGDGVNLDVLNILGVVDLLPNVV